MGSNYSYGARNLSKRQPQIQNYNMSSQSFQEFHPQMQYEEKQKIGEDMYPGQNIISPRDQSYQAEMEPEMYDNSTLNQSLRLIRMSAALNQQRRDPNRVINYQPKNQFYQEQYISNLQVSIIPLFLSKEW